MIASEIAYDLQSTMNDQNGKAPDSATSTGSEKDEPDDSLPAQIPYRRDRTPSIVVQSLAGLADGASTYLTESVELSGEEDDAGSSKQNSTSTEADHRSSTEATKKESQTQGGCCDGGSTEGSLNSIPNTLLSSSATQLREQQSTISPLSALANKQQQPGPLNQRIPPKVTPGTNRRLSLTITSTAPRRLSLTVEGMTGSLVNQLSTDSSPSNYPSGSATGSLRNKVALKPGHSLMGWTKLASTAKDLSGTGGKMIEVTPDELAKHDSENDCWVALNGNVYNVTTYLHYHPGGIEELMRGAGRDATDLFNEVHRWVNYESILAKCLVGPYKLESPSTPGRENFATLPKQAANSSSSNESLTNKTSSSSSSGSKQSQDSKGRIVSA